MMMKFAIAFCGLSAFNLTLEVVNSTTPRQPPDTMIERIAYEVKSDH